MGLLYYYIKESTVSVLSLSFLHYLHYERYKYKDQVRKADKYANAVVLLNAVITCTTRTIRVLIALSVPHKLCQYGLPRLFISPIIFALGLIASRIHIFLSKCIYLLCREEKDLFTPSKNLIACATSNEITPVKSKRPTDSFYTIFDDIKMTLFNTSSVLKCK